MGRKKTPKPPYDAAYRRRMHDALDKLLDAGFTTIIIAGKQAYGGYGYHFEGNKTSVYSLCHKLLKRYLDGKL